MASRPIDHNSLLVTDTMYARFFKGEVAKLPIVGRGRLRELEPQIQESAIRIRGMFPLIVKTLTATERNLRNYYCEIHHISASDSSASSRTGSFETTAGTKPIDSKKRKAPEETAPPVKAARQELQREYIGGDTELARYLQEEIAKLPIVKTMNKAEQLRKDQMIQIARDAIKKFGLKSSVVELVKKIFKFYCKYRSLVAPRVTPEEKEAILAAIPRYREGRVVHWAQMRRDLKLDHILPDDFRNVVSWRSRDKLCSQLEEASSRVRSNSSSSISVATAAAASSASSLPSAIVEEHEHLLELFEQLENGDEAEETAHTELVSSASASPSSRTVLSSAAAFSASSPSSTEVGEHGYPLKLFELLEDSEEEETDRTETVSRASAFPSSRTALSSMSTGERSSSGFF